MLNLIESLVLEQNTYIFYSFVFHKTCALFERRSRYDSFPTRHLK